MHFKVDLNAKTAPGDYGCRVEQNYLVMPEQTFLYAASIGMSRADMLVGYSDAFPSNVAAHFNWTVDQAKSANEGLFTLLEANGLKFDRTPPPPRTWGLG